MVIKWFGIRKDLKKEIKIHLEIQKEVAIVAL
jgi:hypothetical protein